MIMMMEWKRIRRKQRVTDAVDNMLLTMSSIHPFPLS